MYDEKAEGLGREFLDELDRVVRLVRAYPLMATQIEEEVRRFLFTRFPYSLIYGIARGNDRGRCRRTSTSRAAILGCSCRVLGWHSQGRLKCPVPFPRRNPPVFRRFPYS